MENNFDELEDIFADLSEQKIVNKPKVSKNLFDYYILNPELLDSDIKSGIIPENIATDLQDAVNVYVEAKNDNPTLFDENDTTSKDKTKVKKNGTSILYQPYDLGFAETLLLSLVVSSIGFVYLCYLYLVI